MSHENTEEKTNEVTEHCPTFECDWKEEYYGWRCTKCGMFYAFGQAPWEDNPDEDYDDDDWSDDDYPWCGDFDEDEYEHEELPPEAQPHDDDCPCCIDFRNE